MIPNKIVSIFIGVFLTLSTVYIGILSWNAYKTHDYIGISPKQSHTIAISGEGKVTAVPDVATLNFGYLSEKKTVAEAQTDNTKIMNSFIAQIKSDLKIDSKDIKTQNYSVYPQYDWTDGKQKLRAYQVSQQVNVKLRNLDNVGRILDLAGTAGLNQVGSLSFEIDNPEKIKEEARVKALQQAKDKADALSGEIGVKLGKIVSYSESDNGGQPSPIYARDMMSLSSGVAKVEVAPNIETGSTDVIINAMIEYEIL